MAGTVSCQDLTRLTQSLKGVTCGVRSRHSAFDIIARGLLARAAFDRRWGVEILAVELWKTFLKVAEYSAPVHVTSPKFILGQWTRISVIRVFGMAWSDSVGKMTYEIWDTCNLMTRSLRRFDASCGNITTFVLQKGCVPARFATRGVLVLVSLRAFSCCR